jgi:hypothetical protein
MHDTGTILRTLANPTHHSSLQLVMALPGPPLALLRRKSLACLPDHVLPVVHWSARRDSLSRDALSLAPNGYNVDQHGTGTGTRATHGMVPTR